MNADTESPPVPSGVYSVTGDEAVTVYWSPMIGADVEGYGVYVSPNPDGPFDQVGQAFGEATDNYVESGLENGVTRYYAVDAFDFDGNRSELSSEFVHDTPRPAGRNLTLHAPCCEPDRTGVDWSKYPGGSAALAVPFDDPMADFVVVEASGLLFLRGTSIQGFENNIQDFGFTESLDDVDWSPEEGWSASPNGVELIADHSYIVWTWDDYFAKFRVVGKSATSVTVDWAYQATDDIDNRFELAPGRMGDSR